MKKIFFLYVLMFVILFATIGGCKNNVTETNSYVLVSEVVKSRTIFPEIKLSEFNNFILLVKKTGSDDEKTQIASFSSFTELTNVKTLIAKGIYDFTLTAIKSGSIFSDTISEFEIKSGDNPLTFNLSFVNYSTEGTGSVSVKLNFPAGVVKAKAGLFVYKSAFDPEIKENEQDTLEVLAGYEPEELLIENNSCSYSKEEIPAGYYLLKFFLYSDEASSILIGDYSELLCVATDFLSTAEREITELEIQHVLFYNLMGGNFTEGLTYQASFSRFSNVALLTEEYIKKQGYTFAGWYENSAYTGDVVTQIDAGTSEDKVLYAKWIPNNDTPYRVEYYLENPNDDNYTLDEELSYNSQGTSDTETNIVPQEIPGFVLKECKQQTIKADGSMVLKIFYKRKIIKITLLGTDTSEIKVKYNADLVIEDPVKEGYTFNHWEIIDNNEQLYIIEGCFQPRFPLKDIVIYPYFIGNPYTIIYNANGGEGTMQNTDAKHGSLVTLRANSFTRDYFTFIGWGTEPNDGVCFYEDGEKVSFNLTNGTVTLYAKWVTTLTTGNIIYTDGSVISRYGEMYLEVYTGKTTVFGKPIKKSIKVSPSADAVPMALIVRSANNNSPALGVAIPYNGGEVKLPWAKAGTFGAGNKTFNISSKNGSVDWAMMQNQDPEGTENPEENYPAFNYALNYSTYQPTGNYTTGWYLPNEEESAHIPGWGDVLIDEMNAYSGNDIWSTKSNKKNAYIRNFYWNGDDDQWEDGGYGIQNKTSLMCTAPVRAFGNEYAITYEFNGGRAGVGTPLTYVENSEIGLIKPKKEGYRFVGWYTSSDYTGEALTYVPKGTKGMLKLYALWIKDTNRILPEGTDGSAGTSWTYVEFGVWPRHLKSENVTIDESVTKTMGFNTYYYGSDDCWYYKESTNSENFYLKVEPIKWRVLTENYNGTGKALLFAEEIYTRKEFYPVMKDSNNYGNSIIRAWLNGTEFKNINGYTVNNYYNNGFLQTVFTKEEQACIERTNVDNSVRSTNPSYKPTQWANGYDYPNTSDKIFLLSVQEATTETYGFTSAIEAADSARKKAVSFYNPMSSGMSYYSWWLRSAGAKCFEVEHGTIYGGTSIITGYLVHYIDEEGKVGQCDFSQSSYGIVPALTISLDKLK